MRIGIIGGGFAGLCAAYYLAKQLPNVEIDLFEGSEKLGGKIQSHRGEYGLIERGAELILDRTDLFSELIDHLQLSEATPARLPFYLCRADGQRQPFHSGLIRTDMEGYRAALRSVLTCSEEQRAELLQRRFSWKKGADQSLTAALKARHGEELAAAYLIPFYQGVYGGSCEELSSAIYLRESTKDAAPLRSIEGGLTEAIVALQRFLSASGRVQLKLRHQVSSIATQAQRWQICAPEQSTALYDRVILAAAPGHIQALLRPLGLGQTMPHVRHRDSQQVHLFFNSRAKALNATGIMIPSPGADEVTAISVLHEKWPERIPPAVSAYRVFLTPQTLLSSEEATGRALAKVTTLFDLDPAHLEHAVVDSWPQGLPSYQVGHLRSCEELLEKASGIAGLHILRSSLYGCGLADCIEAARDCTLSVLEDLDRN